MTNYLLICHLAYIGKEKNMNDIILQKIKKKALEDSIPILMDDTLREMEKYLETKKPKKFLEIGTAVRIFCNLLFKIFK